MGTTCGKPEDTLIVATNSRQRPSSHLADRQTSGNAEEPTPFHLSHRRWLDGLRGLAVLLVLAFHLHLVPGVAVILVRLLTAPSRLSFGVLESGALVSVGRISYALYLFHLPIIHWLRPARLAWTAPANTLLVTGLSFAAAVISYYGIERPRLRLNLRLQSPGSGSPTRAALRAGVSDEVASSPRVAA
jgi:peptidoglycan/LPS O-acetylase OafA/YrhL